MSCVYSQTNVSQVTDDAFSIVLSKDWDIWGPNGGYLSAILLRAVGAFCCHSQPISIHVQYLAVAKYNQADITVRPVKQGRSMSAYNVQLHQDGKTIANAQVQTGNPQEGIEHLYLPLPPTYCELENAKDRSIRGDMPFWENLEIRSGKKAEGHWGNWYRFDEDIKPIDSFAEAARSIVLIDSMQWPAAWRAHNGKVPYTAPSLDLYVQFHQPAFDSPWLFSNAHAQTAAQGLVGGTAPVWDESSILIASGGSQSLCRRLP